MFKNLIAILLLVFSLSAFGQLGSSTTGIETDKISPNTTMKVQATSDFHVLSSGAIGIPSGTTGERPTESIPLFRFNEDTSSFEVYDGSSWGSIGSGAGGIPSIGTSTDNGIATWDGTSGDTIQSTGVTVDDSDLLTVPDIDVTNSFDVGSSSTINSILDEDGMASDSSTSLATQQSIKAYVDTENNNQTHNSLQGLQGGASTEYYHIPLSEHDNLVDANAQLGNLHTDGTPTFGDTTFNGFIDLGRFTNCDDPVASTGRFFWCDDDDVPYFYDGDGELFGVGRDITRRVRNVEGSTINRGDVVYVSGSSGQNPDVELALSGTVSTSTPLGVVKSSSISDNAVGKIVLFGRLLDVDTSGFTSGDVLYLSDSSAGQITTSETSVRVGVAIDSAASGQISVSIQPEIGGGGGGLEKWTGSTEFEADTVIWEETTKNLYVTDTTFTTGGSFDSTNWDELSKTDDGELRIDPSFEYGAIGFSCTDAGVTHAAGGVDGDYHVQIDFTADGGFCEVENTVSGDKDDVEYTPSVYLKTSDTNVGVGFYDGTRLVSDPEVTNSGNYPGVPYGTQITPSTSIKTRITGNNGDQAFVDMLSHKLGGLGTFDSTVVHKVRGQGNGGQTIGTGDDIPYTETHDPDGLWDGNSYNVQTDNSKITIHACASFTDTNPRRLRLYRNGSFHMDTEHDNGSIGLACGTFVGTGFSKGDTLSVRSISNAGTLVDGSSHKIEITEQYERGGGITTGGNEGAALTVTNEGTTTNVTIGNATITVPFDTAKREDLISWDTANDQGTVQKTGKYRIHASLPLGSGTDNSTVFFYPVVDRGSGFVRFVDQDDSESGVTLNSQPQGDDKYSDEWIVNLNKGDVIELRVTGSSSNDRINQSTRIYPRMNITPVLDRETIAADLQDITKGNTGKKEKKCRFSQMSNTSTPSFSSIDNCVTNETRVSTGLYQFDIVDGYFENGEELYCSTSMHITNRSIAIYDDATGQNSRPIMGSTIEIDERLNTDGSSTDGSFTVTCEGLAP